MRGRSATRDRAPAPGGPQPPHARYGVTVFMSWTDERVEMLQQMWSEGQSAAQIAKTLGGVTRNAVIGKVHRLGLSNRAPAAAARPAAADHEPAPEARAAGKGEAGAGQPQAPADDPSDAAAASAEPAEAVGDAPAVAARRVADAAPEPSAEAETEPARAPASAPAAGIAPVAPPRPAARDPLRREPAPMTEERLEVLANLAEIEKTARGVTLMELTERICKWPIGDPTDPAFRFCGLPAQPGKPYCEAHVAVAFQPMSSRRDRDRQRVRN